MKTCNKCGVTKDDSLFHRRNGRPNGLQASCIDCKKKYRSENQERTAATSKVRYLKNRESILEKSAKWHAENKERRAATKKVWYAANIEHVKSYAVKNAAKIKARYSIWYEKYKPIRSAKDLMWRSENRARVYARNRVRRAKLKGSYGTHTANDVDFILQVQRGKCAYEWCGVSLESGYHVDHVMPLALGGSNCKTNLQLLCPTCNLKKGAKHPIDFAQQNGALL